MAFGFFGGSAGFGRVSIGNEVISAATLGSLPVFTMHVDENGPTGNFNPYGPLPAQVVQGMPRQDYFRNSL